MWCVPCSNDNDNLGFVLRCTLKRLLGIDELGTFSREYYSEEMNHKQPKIKICTVQYKLVKLALFQPMLPICHTSTCKWTLAADRPAAASVKMR